MNCPSDGTTLLMSERQGIEIDYCPECRGVWLDRGELDKILERVQAEAAATAQPTATPAPAPHMQPPATQQRSDFDRRDPHADDRRDYDRRDDRHEYDRRSNERRFDDRYDSRGSSRKKRNKFEWLGDLFES